MVNETIFPFVDSAIFFLFSFCLMGHNIEFEIMLMIININNINNNNDSKWILNNNNNNNNMALDK